MSSPSSNSSRKRSANATHSQPKITDAFKRPKHSEPSDQSSKPRPQHRSNSHKTPASQKPAQNAPAATSSASSSTLNITESTGDIFAAPNNTLLIHACNCQASWSAGIAKAFKDNYPQAFGKYAAHCKKWDADQLFATALLIPPSESAFDEAGEPGLKKSGKQIEREANDTIDEGLGDEVDDEEANDPDRDAKAVVQDGPGDPATHFVGCLFTSHYFGRRKDSPSRILAATKPAMEDLLRQVGMYNESVEKGKRIREVRMCKINSGLFNVPWEKTRKLLEGIDVSTTGLTEVRVVSREE